MSSLALVHVPNYDDPAWTPTPRSRPDFWQSNQLAIAFVDGWYLAIEAVFGPIDRSPSGRLLHQAHQTICPTYGRLRDYLAFDCDVDYLVACRIALRHTTPMMRLF